MNGVYTQRYNRMEKTDGALYSSIPGSDKFIRSITSDLENHPEIPELKTLRLTIGLGQLV